MRGGDDATGAGDVLTTATLSIMPVVAGLCRLGDDRHALATRWTSLNLLVFRHRWSPDADGLYRGLSMDAYCRESSAHLFLPKPAGAVGRLLLW